MPKIQLASQRLNTGGASGGLQPTLLNAGSAIQVAQINPGAGALHFTPTPQAPYVMDTTLESAAKAGQIATQAAFQFHDREATAQAQSVLAELEVKLDTALLEYRQKEGRAGTEGYAEYQDQVRTLTGQYLNSQDSYVKSKIAVPASMLQSKALNSGSMHKVEQLKVWQGDIVAANEQKTLNEVYGLSADPEAFQKGLLAHASLIGQQYAGRPEVARLKQTEFVEKAFLNTIETHTRMGDYTQAGEYIQMASAAGVDPVKVATSYSFWQNQMEAQTNSRMTNIYNEERAYELQQKQEFRAKYRFMIDNAQQLGAEGLARLADETTDPEYRQKLIDAIPDIINGRPATAYDITAIHENASTYIDNPKLIFADHPSVPQKTKNDMFDHYSKIRDTGLGEEAKRVNTWLEQIYPKLSKYEDFDGALEIERNNAMNSAKLEFAMVLDRIKKENLDPTTTINDWKTSYITSNNTLRNSTFKIPRSALHEIKSSTGQSFDLLHLDAAAVTAGADWPQIVEKEFGKRVKELTLSVVDKKAFMQASPQAQAKMMVDLQRSPQYKKLKNDLAELQYQRSHYLRTYGGTQE